MQCTETEVTRLRLMAKVFECVSEAVVITDADNRIITVNPAFTKMTGYLAGEVIGRDPSILASGHTKREVYIEMWRGIVDKGFWQGEVWDRRCDGSVYPKWLAISTLQSAEGEIENYIASFVDISDRKEAADRLFHLAHHDPLTGMLNRIALEAQMDNAFAAARRSDRSVAILLIDMDNFKQVNDTLGHHFGDKLLVGIAGRLVNCVRASDVVARLGGDEFVIVLRDIDNVLCVAGIASKLQRVLEEQYDLDGHLMYSTPSIGIAVFPGDGEDPETLLKNADAAMYHAKSSGRNNYKFFAASMNSAAKERLRLENGLRKAIRETSLLGEAEFVLHFQPQIDINTGRITGLEALCRWMHPEWGMIPPNTFIPIAEETGLIQPLGDWVFWESFRRLREFKDGGMSGVRIAVNLSTQQLRHENLPVVVRGALAAYDLRPQDLELEITESTAMQNPEATIAILQQLSDMGIVLAIDDFGTGYSSLSYLKHLPIHRLKLDRSFVKEIDNNGNDAAICSATIMLGHTLGLDLVAEGVETNGQRDFLKRLGCDLLQGFLYSRPLPAEEILPFVLAWNSRAQPL